MPPDFTRWFLVTFEVVWCQANLYSWCLAIIICNFVSSENDILLAFHFVDQFLQIWFPCFIYSTLKSLRHSTFLRFWLKKYLLFFTVFPDTKNASQILFFANYFCITPKLINFNHIYIKLNNCCYNFYKMFIMLNMAFKCDQKSSCDVWWQSFDLHMGYRALAVLKGPMVLLQIYEIY